jgi:hypothetical protein
MKQTWDAKSYMAPLIEVSLENCLAGLKTIEETFGHGWLVKRVRKQGSAEWHPIPRAWNELGRILEAEQVERTGRIGLSTDAVRLLSFAADLALVRHLKGFTACIPPKELKIGTFEKHEHTIYIAASSVRAGHQIELVLTSKTLGQRTADLKLVTEPVPVYMECKRKDAYKPKAGSGEHLEYIWGQLQNPTPSENWDGDEVGNHEVVILVAGEPQQEAMASLVSFVKGLLKEQKRGIFFSPTASSFVSVQEPSPAPPGAENGVWLPGDGKASEVLAQFYVDDQGRMHVTQQRRVGVYLVDSHRIDAIIQSFDNARGQIPPNGVGLIYICVDVAHVRENELLPYLRLIGTSVAQKFTPTSNSRVGAVILVTEPIGYAPSSNKTGFALERAVCVVRNPYSPLPAEFLIPGKVPRT